MNFKDAYSRVPKVQVEFLDPTLTKQCFQEECDINEIMKKYDETGVVEHENRFKGDYGDYISVQDYHTSLNQIIAAEEMFDTLPSKLRLRFANDPAEFLSFVENPANEQEMIDLGLKAKPPLPEINGSSVEPDTVQKKTVIVKKDEVKKEQ